MKLEIDSACNFIIHLIRLKGEPIDETTLQMLWTNLNHIMYRKYKYHWFIDKPNKSSAFRCIRCNKDHVDFLIAEACELSKISKNVLQNYLPTEFILWIDPGEVYYRIGNNQMCVLYSSEDKKAWKHDKIYSSKRLLQNCTHLFIRATNYFVQISNNLKNYLSTIKIKR